MSFPTKNGSSSIVIVRTSCCSKLKICGVFIFLLIPFFDIILNRKRGENSMEEFNMDVDALFKQTVFKTVNKEFKIDFQNDESFSNRN